MLSKQSATNGWRVAPKEFFTKNASHIAGNDTFHALQVFILFLKIILKFVKSTNTNLLKVTHIKTITKLSSEKFEKKSGKFEGKFSLQ